MSSLIVKVRQPDEKPEEDQDDKDAAIHACASDLINAIHEKNIPAAADAIKSAFEILDSMPHEEGEHTSPHTYEDQKEED